MSIQIHYYGHSSLCIESENEAIFFHPNFSPRNLFFKRRPLPLPSPELISKVRAVVLSSGRYADCDLFSFKYFDSHTAILAPNGLGRFLSNHLPNPVIELYGGCDTPFRGFHIQGVSAGRDLKLLRPCRGSEHLNYLLNWNGKHLQFIFNEPAPETLHHWQTHKADALFLSLNESPWRELVRARTGLPAYITRFLSKPEEGERIIPIGWGGFANRNAQTSPTLEAWNVFTSAQPATIQNATALIEVGSTITLE